MVSEAERQSIVDDEDLRLLPVFFWVSGTMDAFASAFGLLYVAIGFSLVLTPMASGSDQSAPPAFLGWVFAIGGLVFMTWMAAVAALKIVAGFSIRGRRNRALCLVAAGIACFSLPYGTMLGVFSFIVLLRPSVLALFEKGAAPEKPSAAQVGEPS